MEKKEKHLFGTAKHFKVKVKKAKEPPLKFIVSVMSYAMFILLFLVGATLFVYVLDIKIKEAKGIQYTPEYNAYVVLTGSMIPEILINDVVVTKKEEAKSLETGDIITFISTDPRFTGMTITHRIINKYVDNVTGEYSFQTRGDNNPSPDSVLTRENKILGKVILKIPKLGYLQDILSSKGGLIIAVLIPCLVILSYDIMKIFKKIGIKANVIKE